MLFYLRKHFVFPISNWMENGLNFFISFVEAHRFIGYAILFVGMLLEGETILIGAGILIYLKAFDPFDTFMIAIPGVIIGDFLWYYLGMFLHKRYAENKMIIYAKKNILRLLPNFEQKPFWSIFVSKFIYGLNHSALIFSGFLKINLTLFAKAEILASIIWTIGNLILGYIMSYAAINVTHNIKFFGIIIISLVLAFIGTQRLIIYIARARASAQKQNGNKNSE